MTRLTHNFDFRSELCGVGKLESKPYVYYANSIIDINVKFCVEKCPQNSVTLSNPISFYPKLFSIGRSNLLVRC